MSKTLINIDVKFIFLMISRITLTYSVAYKIIIFAERSEQSDSQTQISRMLLCNRFNGLKLVKAKNREI